MNPTKEKIVELANKADLIQVIEKHTDGTVTLQVPNFSNLAKFYVLAVEHFLQTKNQYMTNDASREAALADAYAAGRESGLERAAEVCDEQEKRSRESSDKSKRERDRFMYRHWALTAKWNAAAIRALKGEKE